ncbi:DUF3679 domain-containing protein [Rossellomorea aquimaris]|uniref:DUF3679 domain-containing protein n=1 Tax=Rossellomorea aquimaris TaxID=189382 RepID=A0A1J6WQX8_9BACI|nr:DUF3679 domain-containing protein [Rossellomorea aquimaris]OIU70619.1 hypothetical protein BHE18_19045 [Rossellomorea aquimaris]
MSKFIMKCIVLICCLFVGVLIGMQHANKGIIEMKGHEKESFSSPVGMTQDQEGNVEATFLGKEVESQTLTEKKEKLEEMKAFNAFSSIGKALAGFIEGITTKIVEFIASLI